MNQSIGLRRCQKVNGAVTADKREATRLPTIMVRPRPAPCQPDAAARWWMGGDPVATAWHNALSASFPRGEAYFIESLQPFRADAPPALAEAIRAFCAQEANHAHAHAGFNRAVADGGYDLARIDTRLERLLDRARERGPVFNLAATMVLEHFTAIFAHDILANPQNYAGADPAILQLWRWHAAEEIEHKAVAFDTFLHVTRHWTPGRRWRVRAAMMFEVSRKFFRHRVEDSLDLLAQDGFSGWKTRLKLAHYLLVRPGVLARVFAAWLAWFRPGFHPWQRDDLALLEGLGEAA